jgi:hypothetical protein
MVAVLRIEPVKRTAKPGSRPCGPSGVFSSHVKLRSIVASELILDWSPEQISGWLKIQYPDDENMRVSHEMSRLARKRNLFLGTLKGDFSASGITSDW